MPCDSSSYLPLRLHSVEVALDPVAFELQVVSTSIPAGFPSPAADDTEDPIDLGQWLVENPAASYVMRVEGHSMTGAGIGDGDMIVVSRSIRPRVGHIVVAVVHGERTLKRLTRIDERLWLVPEAEGYPNIIVDEFVEIWGVVAGLARRYV